MVIFIHVLYLADQNATASASSPNGSLNNSRLNGSSTTENGHEPTPKKVITNLY